MKCPYCHHNNVKPPKVKKWETPSFAHGTCPDCGHKPRATVSWGQNGEMLISYARDGRRAMPEYERKSIKAQKCFSPRDINDVKSGRKRLTFGDGGIILLLDK